MSAHRTTRRSSPGALSKLEAAISKQRTIKFAYWSPQRDKVDGADAEPVRAAPRRGRLVRRRAGSRPRGRADVPRLAHPQRHPLRDPARARLPAPGRVRRRGAPRPAAVADRRPGRHGPHRRPGRHRLVGRTERSPTPARSRTASSRRRSRGSSRLPAGSCARTGAPSHSSRRRYCDAVADGLARLRDAHEGEGIAPARERRVEAPGDRGDRPVGPIAPERFGVLQALLAHLLSPAARAARRISTPTISSARFSIPREELQDTLSLLNLVNFGGGCYTVYAEVDEDTGDVRVDKELYGDVFRRPPKLTPLEARAISLAIDYVGPTIAAEAGTPLDRVRRKLRGDLRPVRRSAAPGGSAGDAEEQLVRTLSDAVEKRPRGRDRVPQGGRGKPDDALRRAVHVRARAPVLARAHVGPNGRRTAHLPARPHALGTAHRRGVRAPCRLRPQLPPRAAHGEALALAGRRALEARARRTPAHRQGGDLATCRTRRTSGSSPRCSATAARRSSLEPAEARAMVATRAKALQQELGVSARRKRPAARA